jgi:predicted O-linked N-acetylglucosamine transferase (SPINDLY family)
VALSDEAEAAHLEGLSALKRGAKDEARRAFERALELDPSRVKTLNNLARLELDAGEAARARELVDRALGVEPDAPRTLALSAQARLAEGLLDEAASALERATGGPTAAALWNNLGSALVRAGRDADALAAFERSVRLDGTRPEVLANLGDALRRAHDLERAEAVLQDALSRAPHDPAATLSLAKLLDETLRQDEAVAALEAAIPTATGELRRRLGSSRLMHLNHHDGTSADALVRAHRDWAREWLPPRESTGPRATRHEGPLRVGYLSSDLRDHVVMKFLLPVLEAHDRSKVDVCLLSMTRERDAVTGRIEQRHRVVDLSSLEPAELTRTVRELELDVVVELNGHTDDAVMMALEDRLAPVQLSYLGYPSTTGLDRFDGRITDAVVDPAGTEAQYTEPLVRLPRCMWAFVPRGLPDVVERPPAGVITFGCFNRVGKLSRTILDAWAEILRRVPESRLLLRARGFAHPSVRARALERFGEVAGRVGFADFAPNEGAAFAGYGAIDVALDTFPYHGTTTTCDALVMGVPVVSFCGALPASRVARSLLGAVGLGDLVAEDREGYVERAVGLARDADRRASLRTSLRDAVRGGPLGDAAGLAGALEEAYAACLETARARGGT